MKKLSLFLAIFLFLALASRAHATTLPVFGPATFNVTASTQNLFYILVSAKTNHTTTSTNTTVVEKSTASSFAINSAYLLNLMTNSLNTNLPPGAKLIMQGSESSFFFYVTDSNGVVVVNQSTVATVLKLVSPAHTTAGSYTFITTETASGKTYAGNDTEVYTDYMILTYDDTLLTTADLTHSNFQFGGMLVNKYSENIGTGKFKESISMPGTGGGQIRNKLVVLKGSLTGQLTGFLPP